MAVKRTGQLSLAEAFFGRSLGRPSRLDDIDALVRWYRFDKLLKRLVDDGAGRPAYPPLVMFKALLVQSLYGLSDAELEEAIADRLSFRRFIGLSLDDPVPDHTTLCRFRNRLREAGLLDRLFGELDRQLEAAGMMVKAGTMLDATLIGTAAARPPRREEPRDADAGPARREEQAGDPDAGFAKRQGKAGFSYGYKLHVAVDQGSGLIRRLITTPANVNETTVADQLVCGDERAVLADAAYHTHARERWLKERGIKPRLMRRPNKHYRKLPARLQRYNQLIARRRAGVETTFATFKRRMGVTAIRYLGLAKAAGQMMLAAMAFNLRRWAALSSA
jgi:IS5 family transposase